MTFLESITLGTVQGLTEFLPVSSDGHLTVLQHGFAYITGVRRPGGDNICFDVMLHIGTLLAILVYYRRSIVSGCRGLNGSTSVERCYQRPQVVRAAWLAGLATLPLIPLKLYFKSYIDATFESICVTGLGFLVTAGVLCFTLLLRGDGQKGLAETRWSDALIIGLVQMFAPLPGVSRSGLTIVAALLLGLSRTWAVGFSLLIAIPAIVGAAGFELLRSGPVTSEIVVGMVVAGVVGYLAICWLTVVTLSGKLWWFAAYLVVLATACVLTSYIV